MRYRMAPFSFPLQSHAGMMLGYAKMWNQRRFKNFSEDVHKS